MALQVGTPGYMAPEVMHKERKTVGYSWPADMWSLGIMIWELVDGLPPRWAPMSWYWTPTIHFPERFSKVRGVSRSTTRLTETAAPGAQA